MNSLCEQTEITNILIRKSQNLPWTVYNKWGNCDNYCTISIWYQHKFEYGHMHYEVRWEPSSADFDTEQLIIIQGQKYAETLPRWLTMA